MVAHTELENTIPEPGVTPSQSFKHEWRPESRAWTQMPDMLKIGVLRNQLHMGGV